MKGVACFDPSSSQVMLSSFVLFCISCGMLILWVVSTLFLLICVRDFTKIILNFVPVRILWQIFNKTHTDDRYADLKKCDSPAELFDLIIEL